MIKSRIPFPRFSSALLILTSLCAFAADEGPSEMELFSLEDRLNQTVRVAATQALKEQEAPGIVTVITRDEMQASGARDLIDVLMLVPGFSFGVDVEGVTDVGFRGVWAHEGKMLILIDGQEMNELLFQNNELGNHYPIDQIERIEIVRGPGSVLYGGMAELGVINITTRGPKELSGFVASVGYGQMAHTLGLATLSLAGGAESVAGVEGLDISVTGFVGRGNRSDATYTDFYGNSYSMAGRSQLAPVFFNVGARYRDLHVRFIYDGYSIGEADSGGAVSPMVSRENFTTMIADVQYDLKVTEWLTISPRLTYKLQNPWQVTDVASPNFFDVTVQRVTASVVGTGKFLNTLQVTAGLQLYDDRAWLGMGNNANSSFNIGTGYQIPLDAAGDTKVSYNTLAALVEAEWSSSLFGLLTAGARFEHNTVFGDSFVPRFAITKTLGKFHFKGIFQYAFRPPSLGDIAQEQTALSPERTRDAEIELGYRLNSHMSLTANVFDLHIANPIIYTLVGSTNYYANFSQTGTEGLEIDFRVNYPKVRADLNYSYYTSFSLLAGTDQNQVPLYDAGQSSSAVLAFPSHKIAGSAKLSVWRSLSITPSVIFMSPRYGYLSGDGNGNGVLGQTPSLVLANVFANYENLGVKGFNLGLGVFNLFDTPFTFIQPYASSHAPLPGPTRELVAKASLAF